MERDNGNDLDRCSLSKFPPHLIPLPQGERISLRTSKNSCFLTRNRYNDFVFGFYDEPKTMNRIPGAVAQLGERPYGRSAGRRPRLGVRSSGLEIIESFWRLFFVGNHYDDFGFHYEQ